MWNEFLSCARWPLILGLLLSGCLSEPADVAEQELDLAAADRALKEYDSNGDQKLSRDELKKSPGLFSSVELLDQNRDGSISSDELQGMLQEIQLLQGALVELTCTVTHNNRPLEGATVELMPESFFGDAAKPASGVTDADGTTQLSIDAEELRAASPDNMKGVHCGIYRVIVTHPNVAIPAKYNTQSELGRIVSRSVRGPLQIAL